jgi:hypothetical protein
VFKKPQLGQIKCILLIHILDIFIFPFFSFDQFARVFGADLFWVLKPTSGILAEYAVDHTEVGVVLLPFRGKEIGLSVVVFRALGPAISHTIPADI